MHHKFLSFCANQRSGNVNFVEPDSDRPAPKESDVMVEAPLAESNAVSSLVKEVVGAEVHKPMLDLDMPCLLLDSTTPGHHHLFIDKELSWEAYEDILKTLARHGILQRGFVDASLRRKHTQLRTPWTKKEVMSQW